MQTPGQAFHTKDWHDRKVRNWASTSWAASIQPFRGAARCLDVEVDGVTMWCCFFKLGIENRAKSLKKNGPESSKDTVVQPHTKCSRTLHIFKQAIFPTQRPHRARMNQATPSGARCRALTHMMDERTVTVGYLSYQS